MVLALVLTFAAVVAALAAVPRSSDVPVFAPAAGRPPLAFDLPPTAVLRASGRTAFAHYIPTFPLSLDDRPPDSDYYATAYLDPAGEHGKHAGYGGYLRDRPLGRAPRAVPDWREQDLRLEVREAVSAGLDGFSLDLLQLGDTGGPLWDTSRSLVRAAEQEDPGFRILLMPDMAALHDTDPATLASSVEELGRSPSAYRTPDGRLVVSPFLAEARPASWWQQFLQVMSDRGTPAALLPVFLDATPHLEEFAPFSWGLSEWGSRSPARNDVAAAGPDAPLPEIAAVHGRGLVWMQPVSVQDERPREGLFDEAGGSENLRRTWQVAIDSGAELVQVATWNDYAEGSGVAPSVHHGWTFLDLSSWYLTVWKLRSTPPVVRDTVLLVHRVQEVGARPARPQALLMRLRDGSSPARDRVEVVALLRAPGTVDVWTERGRTSCRAPAGLSVCTAPLVPGPVAASASRDGDRVTGVTSPYRVRASPPVQDLQYVAATSGRPAPGTG